MAFLSSLVRNAQQEQPHDHQRERVFWCYPFLDRDALDEVADSSGDDDDNTVDLMPDPLR